MTLAPKALIDSVYVLGVPFNYNLGGLTTGGEVSGSTTEVTQLDLTIVDPELTVLKKNTFKTGLSLKFSDYNAIITNVGLSGEESVPTVKISARPKLVSNLKAARGAKSLSNVSPSFFVEQEVKAAGGTAICQPSAVRTQVSRDVPKSGETYDQNSQPSSWTTIDRLAQELGYTFFESSNVVYFGKPTWLLDRSKASPLTVTYVHRPTSGNMLPTEPLAIPNCTESLEGDSKYTIDVKLPLTRYSEARVGRAMKITGVGSYDGTYLITQVSYPLGDPTGAVSVTAQVPVDPTALGEGKVDTQFSNLRNVLGQKDYSNFLSKMNLQMTQYAQNSSLPANTTPGAAPVTNGSGYTSSGNFSNGNPISGSFAFPTRSHIITAPFGRRGSWAAGYHTGTDYAASIGTPVYAICNATVTSDNWGPAYGRQVILSLGSWGKVAYCHLSSITVSAGNRVNGGQIIGYSGNTGRSFGPHLHVEWRVGPRYRYGTDSRNPEELFKKLRNAPTKNTAPPPSSSRSANTFVTYCLQQVGDRYVYGARVKARDPNPGVWDCVEKGTLLQTPNGPTAIEKLKVGDPVWSINPDTHELEVKPVRTVFPETEHKAWVTRTNGRQLRTSYNHKMIVVEKDRTRDSKGRWNPVEWNFKTVLAKDVKRGDYVLTPKKIKDTGEKTFLHDGTEIDQRLAWLLGYYVGDGSYSGHSSMTFHAYKDYQRDLITGILEDYWEYSPKRNKYDLGVHNSHITQLFQNSGISFENGVRRLGPEKSVPEIILKAKDHIKRSFLEGYRSADGHIDKRGYVSYSSCSKVLIEQTRAMWIGLGKRVSRVSKAPRTKNIYIKGKRIENAKPLFSYDVYIRDAPTQKREGQLLMKNYGGDRSFPDGHFEIKKVTESFGTEEVIKTYDIEVAENHNFVADIVTSNCSELVWWAAHRVGCTNVPDGSSAQYHFCKTISLSEGLRTRGALLFNVVVSNYTAPQIPHVAISLGDGNTVEARNSKYGVGRWSAGGRFNAAGLIPGMSYNNSKGASTGPGTGRGGGGGGGGPVIQ